MVTHYDIRKDFPIFNRKIRGKELVYLDNAATSQKPIQVISKIEEFYRNHNANIHRSVHTLGYEATVEYEEAHKKVARFINARSWQEIIFVRNATEGINLIAYSLGLNILKPQDEIIIAISEHHSNLVPWQFVARRTSSKLKFIDIDDDYRLRLDQFESMLSERTKIVSVGHVSNITGVINPIKEIVRLAKKVGAITVIDGAQGLPHLKVDVQDIGCDFYVGTGHKMCGPTGIGFVYGRKEILENMEPFMYGGDMIETVTTEKSTWNELPWKFEAGTANIAGGIGLGYAVDYLESIGMEMIEELEKEITEYTLEVLSSIDKVKLFCPRDTKDRLGVFSFAIEGVHPHDVAYILDREGIAIRSGHHCAQPLLNRIGASDGSARISTYIYNTKEDIDKAAQAIQKVIYTFKI
ncbi:MAG: cysteine desulfurase [Spirochaetia bacterium]|nr:cysteine desulfurase [Spirochaetota bacterium]MCX8096620.1 cysteine desulfurase [Spirochaetota bacterium]MDW8112067.1 cysteine desulfurase [Spirochaetia bacterium]